MTGGYSPPGLTAEGYQPSAQDPPAYGEPPYPPPPPYPLYGPYGPYPPPLMSGGYPYYYPYYPAPLAPSTNSFAIVSLILSICGVVMLGLVGSILGVTFGHIAQSQIKRAAVPEEGSGLATAGLIIGYFGIGWNIVLIALYIFFVLIFPLLLLNSIPATGG
jgi:hypothetical protein